MEFVGTPEAFDTPPISRVRNPGISDARM